MFRSHPKTFQNPVGQSVGSKFCQVFINLVNPEESSWQSSKSLAAIFDFTTTNFFNVRTYALALKSDLIFGSQVYLDHFLKRPPC